VIAGYLISKPDEPEIGINARTLESQNSFLMTPWNGYNTPCLVRTYNVPCSVELKPSTEGSKLTETLASLCFSTEGISENEFGVEAIEDACSSCEAKSGTVEMRVTASISIFRRATQSPVIKNGPGQTVSDFIPTGY
jgi:hypothetical protein